MGVKLRVGLAFLVALGLSVLATTGTAVADEKYNRTKAAYEALLKQGKTLAPRSNPNWKTVTINGKQVKTWQGPAPRIAAVGAEPGPNPVQPVQPVQTAVKVWAELSDPAGTFSGQLVNIELYKWKAKQQFYFWLESPTPVTLTLFQNFDVGNAAAKEPKLVSPNPAFPLTYTTVEPGVPFRFPQLFETDNDLRDEFVTLTILAAGQSVPVGPVGPNTPPPPVVEPPLNNPANTNVNTNTLNNQTNVNISLNPGPIERSGGTTRFRSPAREAQRLSASNPDLPQGTNPQTFTSPNAAQVAMFALGSQNLGHLPLRFSK